MATRQITRVDRSWPLRRLRLALWCTLALLGAQALVPALAQWHGVWHGAAHALASLQGAPGSAEPHAGGLHDHAPGSVECQQWDQLLLADAPPAATAVAMCSPVPAAPTASPTAEVQPAPVWGRSARAPPGPRLPS